MELSIREFIAETFAAVKRAGENSLHGQKDFLTEIELLSRLHH
jgi:hypothetical protein